MLKNSYIMKQTQFNNKAALEKTVISSSSSIQFRFYHQPIVSVQSHARGDSETQSPQGN